MFTTTASDELIQTLNCWRQVPAGGSPLDIEPDWDEPDVCQECGGSRYVFRPNAICYANEQDAEMPCPSCCPIEFD